MRIITLSLRFPLGAHEELLVDKTQKSTCVDLGIKHAVACDINDWSLALESRLEHVRSSERPVATKFLRSLRRMRKEVWRLSTSMGTAVVVNSHGAQDVSLSLCSRFPEDLRRS